MNLSWAVEGITDEVPRTTGPECINYMTNRRRWIETVLFSAGFLLLIKRSVRRLKPIIVSQNELDKPHTAIRFLLMLSMTFIFGVEVGFKFAGKSMLFILNPCHVQTLVQIYLLASRPTKVNIAIFRILMSNINGPFLAFIFPEVEHRDLPFEQATYWIQHALLYIIPVYLLRSGAYTVEEMNDYNWVVIGVMVMLLYHFVILSSLSILTGINLSHMLCAAVADPFQGQNYRIAAVIHESILCPILNKGTVFIFNRRTNDDRNSNQHRYSKFSEIEQMPSKLVTKTKRLSVGNIVDGSGNNMEADFLYHQRWIDQRSTVPILKHRRRHTTEYINDSPEELGVEHTGATLMPTTKID